MDVKGSPIRNSFTGVEPHCHLSPRRDTRHREGETDPHISSDPEASGPPTPTFLTCATSRIRPHRGKGRSASTHHLSAADTEIDNGALEERGSGRGQSWDTRHGGSHNSKEKATMEGAGVGDYDIYPPPPFYHYHLHHSGGTKCGTGTGISEEVPDAGQEVGSATATPLQDVKHQKSRGYPKDLEIDHTHVQREGKGRGGD